MDEPLGALDRQLREQMQLAIKHIHGEEKRRSPDAQFSLTGRDTSLMIYWICALPPRPKHQPKLAACDPGVP